MRRVPILLLVVIAACEADPGASADAGGGAGDGGSSSTTPDHVRYRGQLATTPTVAFGGAPYCMYDVALRDVVLDVVLRGADELVSMTIDDTMTEGIVGTCTFAPAPPNRQQFAFGGEPLAASAAGVFRPLLVGRPGNQPMTDATVAVTPINPATLEATPRWARTDQGPPLAWIVEVPAPIALPAVACEVGARVCVGGSTEGVLYDCADGRNMAPVRRCTAGCASPAACN